jgi:hypothetical protein
MMFLQAYHCCRRCASDGGLPSVVPGTWTRPKLRSSCIANFLAPSLAWLSHRVWARSKAFRLMQSTGAQRTLCHLPINFCPPWISRAPPPPPAPLEDANTTFESQIVLRTFCSIVGLVVAQCGLGLRLFRLVNPLVYSARRAIFPVISVFPGCPPMCSRIQLLL